MRLLCFAHKNEAKTFIKMLNLSLSNERLKIYSNNDLYLLITGEGNQQTTENLCLALSSLKDITEILNMGVAGSLNKDYTRGDLLSVRTAYQFSDDFSFKSFTSADTHAKNDCMSAMKRLNTSEEKKKVSIYADLVDREVWAIGSVAQKFKLPWRSLKIVSDDINSEANCNLIKEDAEYYSNTLFHAFQEIHELEVSKNGSNSFSIDSDTFYFTHSQKHELHKLLKTLEQREVGFTDKFMNSDSYRGIVQSKLSPKLRAKKILSCLLEQYDPPLYQAQSKLKEKISKLNIDQIHFDSNEFIERKNLKFRGQVKTQADLEIIKNVLNHLDIDGLAR